MTRFVRSLSPTGRHEAGPYAVLMAALLATTSACGGGEATTSAAVGPRGRGGAQGAVPVAIAPVAQKAVPLQLSAVGTAEAYRTVQVRAQMTGNLDTVNFKEGDDVREGQVLFRLDRRPLEAALQQAEANLARDTAQAENAAAQARRIRDLAARGIATREQQDTSQSTATALQATLNADRAAVESAKVQLQYATIASPITGRTGALQVHAGNLVRANDTTSLVTINQVAPINVVFGIPEAVLGDFKHFMAAGSLRVEANPPNATTRPSEGRISFVDNQVDQTTGQIKIKGTFANADRSLWPGEFLNIVVTLKVDAAATVVPSMAVQTGQQGQYVFVVKADRTVEMRSVTVERTVESDSVIRSGLTAGETVVTDGQLNLVAGSRISVKGENAAPRATP